MKKLLQLFSSLSADLKRVVVSYKRKYMDELLVNCLVKLALEKSEARRTDHPNMTKAVDWDVKNQTKTWGGGGGLSCLVMFKAPR